MIPVYQNTVANDIPFQPNIDTLFLVKLIKNTTKTILNTIVGGTKLGFNAIKTPFVIGNQNFKNKIETTRLGKLLIETVEKKNGEKNFEKQHNEFIKNILTGLNEKVEKITDKFDGLLKSVKQLHNVQPSNLSNEVSENVENNEQTNTETNNVINNEIQSKQPELKVPESFFKKLTKTVLGSKKEDSGLLGLLTNPGKWVTGLGLAIENPFIMMLGSKLTDLIKQHKEEKQIFKEQLKLQQKELKVETKQVQQKEIEKQLTEDEEGLKEIKKRNREEQQVEKTETKGNFISKFLKNKFQQNEENGGFLSDLFNNFIQYKTTSMILGKFGGILKKIPGVGKIGGILKKIPGLGKIFTTVEEGAEVGSTGGILTKIGGLFSKIGGVSKFLPLLGKVFGAVQIGELAYGVGKGILSNPEKYNDEGYDSKKHGFFSRVIHGILRPDKAIAGLITSIKGTGELLYDKLFKKSPEEKWYEKAINMVKKRVSKQVWQLYSNYFENSEQPVVSLVKLWREGKLKREMKNKHAFFVLPSEYNEDIKQTQTKVQQITTQQNKQLNVTKVQQTQQKPIQTLKTQNKQLNVTKVQQTTVPQNTTIPTDLNTDNLNFKQQKGSVINIKPNTNKAINLSSDSATINIVQPDKNLLNNIQITEPAKQYNLSPQELPKHNKQFENNQPIIINNNNTTSNNTGSLKLDNDYDAQDNLFIRMKNHFYESKILRFAW